MRPTSSSYQQRTSSSTLKGRSNLQEKSNNKGNPNTVFYRSSSKANQLSPAHSSNNNTLSRHKLGTDPYKESHHTYKPDYLLGSEAQKAHRPHSETIKRLKEQNLLLKQQIAELRVTQFYQFDDQKLKAMLLQLEQAKYEMKKLQDLNQSLQLQNDFLNRANYQLKKQLALKFQESVTNPPENQFRLSKRQNEELDRISATTAFIGKRTNKGNKREETKKTIREVKSAKLLTEFPELHLTEKHSKGQSTQRTGRVDAATLVMKYKKKRGTAASEPENQPGLTDRE